MNRENWLTDVVRPHLFNTFGAHGVDIAVEVGVWRGAYSLSIINALEPAQFIGVDPFRLHADYHDYPDDREFANQLNLDHLYMRTATTFAQCPTAKLIRLQGTEAAEQCADQSLDFVYIDGDHSYDFVHKDINAWYPKLKSGGILAGHDYTPGNPQKGVTYGVIPAVNEFANQHNYVVETTDEQYATWYIIKG
tara:strand:- start:49 stop:627 length:579 start_codon:yes stop_codon:yes gene_type:complete